MAKHYLYERANNTATPPDELIKLFSEECDYSLDVKEALARNTSSPTSLLEQLVALDINSISYIASVQLRDRIK